MHSCKNEIKFRKKRLQEGEKSVILSIVVSSTISMRVWRNWQTRRLVVLYHKMCRFDPVTRTNKTSGVKNFACFAFIPDKAASPANLLSIIPLGNSPFCVLALVSVLYCKRKVYNFGADLTLFHDRLSYKNSRERTVSVNG